MKILLLIIILPLYSTILKAQIPYTIDGTVVNNTETGTWYGVNIPRNEPTKLIYRNNSITSVNTDGYLLQAGDENPSPRDNNLDGMEITGNLFNWQGNNSPSIITHGILTGYNINAIVKYNYLINVPYGIIFKSGTDAGQNMTFTAGGCAYNICKNGKFAVRMKGINGVKVYNNTFYSGDGAGRYLLLITSNQDRTNPSPSTGTKVFNNIFYATMQIPMISIEQGSLENFESDYNIFWCTAGEPTFSVDGVTYSFQQWQNQGFDTHSKIIDPQFNNTNDFIPSERLDYGVDLGKDWETGLAVDATWVAGVSPSTINQNGIWQVGAKIKANKEEPNNDSEESFNIFPNPSDGNFILKINNMPAEGLILEIKNLHGQKLLEQVITDTETEWSVNNYLGTVFFVTVRGSNMNDTKRIVINDFLD